MSILKRINHDEMRYAKAFVGTDGTTVPTSVNPVGDYTTKLIFQSSVRDTIGNSLDLPNSRLIVPAGFARCRVSLNLAWGVNATGWRGCRVKNGAGQNYGNTRLLSVGASATTNTSFATSWLQIVQSGGAAPDSINAGDYFEFWPAHTAGVSLLCGADLASCFVQLEVSRY
jgi:hypothetical protein